MLEFNHASEGLTGLMDRRHMTVSELAAATEIAPATLRGLLSGTTHTVSTRNLVRLARLFDLPLQMLLDYLS